MKEHPVLFSGAMVRGLLNLEIGSWPPKPIDVSKAFKWQTRRLGKTQSAAYVDLRVEYAKHATKGDVAQATHLAYPDRGTARHGIEESRLGIPGDRLWVRESFGIATGKRSQRWKPGTVLFMADAGVNIAGPEVDLMRWKPSIHMRREYSRITLEVMEVRVQRLQEISEEDARAEGVNPIAGEMWVGVENKWGTAKMAFRELLESLYAAKHPWASNCWVWIYNFRRVK